MIKTATILRKLVKLISPFSNKMLHHSRITGKVEWRCCKAVGLENSLEKSATNGICVSRMGCMENIFQRHAKVKDQDQKYTSNQEGGTKQPGWLIHFYLARIVTKDPKYPTLLQIKFICQPSQLIFVFIFAKIMGLFP